MKYINPPENRLVPYLLRVNEFSGMGSSVQPHSGNRGKGILPVEVVLTSPFSWQFLGMMDCLSARNNNWL